MTIQPTVKSVPHVAEQDAETAKNRANGMSTASEPEKATQSLRTPHTDDTEELLFVYGIFLGRNMRKSYNMRLLDNEYATVKDFATVGGYIVKAIHVPNANLSLTGLLVKPDPTMWKQLDSLEAAYKRIKIRTSNGVSAWMYVDPSAALTYKEKASDRDPWDRSSHAR